MTIELKVRPGGNENKLIAKGDLFELTLKAQAESGMANAASIRFLSKQFKVPQKEISIKKGKTARSKVFEIGGISKQEFEDILGKITGR